MANKEYRVKEERDLKGETHFTLERIVDTECLENVTETYLSLLMFGDGGSSVSTKPFWSYMILNAAPLSARAPVIFRTLKLAKKTLQLLKDEDDSKDRKAAESYTKYHNL